MTDNSNLIEFRMANKNDKSSFIDLWKICFEDTEDFIKWFFDNRFFPEYSVCGVIDGTVVCAMQSMPMPIWIRGKSISGAIVVGVCTHPDHRGRHHMKNMFTYYMEQMRQKRIFAITYKPENIQTYFSLGHYPVTRTIHLSVSASAAGQQVQNQSRVAIQPDFINETEFVTDSITEVESGALTFFRTGAINDFSLNELKMCFDLYTSLASYYSGMVDRDMSLFSLKSQDYASVDGRLLMCFNNPNDNELSSNELIGYCFYFDTKKETYGEELLAKNDFALKEIINKFYRLAKGKDLKLKIPPNFSTVLNNYSQDIDNGCAKSPQNVMGITNINEFIRELDIGRFKNRDILKQLVVEVRDPILPENSVKINFLGESSSIHPCISVGIGYFVQSLCGYCNLFDFVSKVDSSSSSDTPIIIYDMEKAKKINEILCLCECFIIDEY